MPGFDRRGRRAVLGVLAVTAIGALTLSGIPQGAAAPTPPGKGGDQRGDSSSRQRDRKGDVDARVGSAKERLRVARDTVADRSSATKALTRKLGSQAVVELDPVTGTPTMVGRLDGFLTKRSSAKARTVALRYVRANAAGLGLSTADLKTLTLRKDYVDVAGIHHLSWTQSVNGIKVFGNGLKANVTKKGQLISIQGAPVPGLAKLARSVTTRPAVTASRARQAAATDVGGTAAKVTATTSTTKGSGARTVWANADQAQLVWFATGSGLRLGWSTYVQAGGDQLNYQHVIDAHTGTVLYRHDTVDRERDTSTVDGSAGQRSTTSGARRSSGTSQASSTADAKRGDALVYDNYPGAPVGGQQKVYNLIDHDLLSPYATQLSGNYASVFSDVNDNDLADTGETVAVPGLTGTGPQYPLVPFNQVSSLCSPSYVCTWDPDRPYSWRTNRRQNA